LNVGQRKNKQIPFIVLSTSIEVLFCRIFGLTP
jgi:hypothetical protein